jgi:hypothetical protein
VNFIPNNGQGVTIQSSIYRSDANDGLKKILSLATTTASQPALTNYAAAAVPYVGMAVDFANQAYAAFGQPTTPWLNEAPSRLHPVGPNYDRFDLREGYLIQYSGNDNPGDGSLYVDSGEVRWVANDTPLRNGSSWILFKIRKIERRTDYTVTNWYRAWDNLLTDCYTSDIESNSFKNRYQQVITLLKADNDYTSGDRDQYVKDFTTVQNAIVTALGQNPVDRAAIRAAIDASRSPVQPANFVAKFGSPKDLPTISGAPTSFKFAIVPSQLANEVRNKFKR